MSATENEQSVRRLIEEGFNAGNPQVVDELVAPTFVERQNVGPGIPPGPDATKAVITGLRAAFPDLCLTIEDMVSSEDTVWMRIRARGTHDGSFFGHASTGRRFEIDVIDVCRFEDGAMVEHWGVADRLGVLLQLGLIRPGVPVAA